MRDNGPIEDQQEILSPSHYRDQLCVGLCVCVGSGDTSDPVHGGGNSKVSCDVEGHKLVNSLKL